MGRKMEKKDNDKRLHNKNFFEAWKNAVNGIIYGTTTQSNVRKQLIIIACVWWQVYFSIYLNWNLYV